MITFIFSSVTCFIVAQESEEEPPPVPPDQLLLRDYRPKSIFQTASTVVEKAKFPVIDMHSHAYAKDELMLEQWVRSMKEVGVEKSIIMVGTAGAGFDQARELYSKYPDQFELWVGIDFDGFNKPGWTEHIVAELERCQKLGARGVGEINDKGRGLRGQREPNNFPTLHADDPRMDPIFEKCAELGLPVSLHIAEPFWMYEPMDKTNDGLMNAHKWQIPEEPGVLRHAELIATFDRAVERHPETIFIVGHMANCSHDLSILARLLDKHPNLYADTGARFAELAPVPRRNREFFTKYQDRILYGTDLGFEKHMYRTTFRLFETEDEHFYPHFMSNYHWAWHGMGLSDQVLRKIYRENALKLRNGLNR